MQDVNLLKSNKPKNQYPYLSIDQLKRGQQKYSELKGQVSEFFNIKFDQRYQNKEQRQSPNKCELGANSTPGYSKAGIRSDIISIIIEKPSDSKHISSHTQPKSKANTEKMLESIQKLLFKEKSFQLKHYLAKPQKKIKKKITDYSIQKNSHTQIQNILCIENAEQKSHVQKAKNVPFHQMLKKCSKLKEITRFEHELLNQKIQIPQKIGLRFYTEPFGSIEQKDESIYQANKFKIRPSVKKTIQAKLSSFFQNSSLQPLKNDNQTLDIRKYNNLSVLKQRTKNAVKKHLLREKRYKEHRQARMSEPVKAKTSTYETSFQKAEDMLAPWDQSQLKYDCQLS